MGTEQQGQQRPAAGSSVQQDAGQSSAVVVSWTHLELPYHRAVRLGLLLVELKGLAEVLQALEGWHRLQLAVVQLQGRKTKPGSGDRGPRLLGLFQSL